jgi:hypothetical protein
MINIIHCIILDLQFGPESDVIIVILLNIHRIEQTFPIPNMSFFAYAPIDYFKLFEDYS